MRRIVKQIWNIATTILVCAAVILAMLLWGVQLFGLELFVVQSGSMEPDYPVGALVYVGHVEPSELQVRDVITFQMEGNKRGTHRIVEIVDVDGQTFYRTKGDANEVEDVALVHPSAVVGRVVFDIPYLGYLVTEIQNPPGLYYAIAAVAVILLLCLLPDLIFKEKKQEETDI